MHESLIKSERIEEDREIHASPVLPKKNLQCLIPHRWVMPRHLIRKKISDTEKISPPAVGRAAEYVPREHSAAEAPWGVEPLSSTVLKPGW